MADLAPYTNARLQVGCCGIHCGSCVVGNGAFWEPARRFDAILSDYDFRKWAPPTFDCGEFDKGIKAAVRAPLCQGCLRGGADPEHPMRRCANGRGLGGCARCADFDACPHAAARRRTAEEA